METVAGDLANIDHDGWFKELHTTFFVESMEMFFPKLAESLDRDSIEFLDKETSASLTDGCAYEADIVVKARFKGSDASSSSMWRIRAARFH